MSKFTKGKSGNPSGRKPGTGNKVTRALREAMLAVYEGMGGEGAMLAWSKKSRTDFYKLLLGKMVPAGAPIRLEPGEDAPADYGRQIVAEMAEGRITPEEAETAMRVIQGQARVIEVDELERRVKALEERSNAKS